MNNKHYKIAVFVLLTVVVGAFTHCVQNSPIGGSSSSGSSRAPSSSPSTAPTPEQVLNQAQVEVGLKSFEQIHYTFSALTGVPVNNGAVAGAYRDVEPTLPGDNEVKVLQSSNQVAIVRLASVYCEEMFNNADPIIRANRDAILGTILVNGNTVSVLTQLPQVLEEDKLVNRFTNAFWGDGVVDAVELAAARDELMDVYNDVVTLEPDASENTPATTNKAARAVCTAALSSAYVTIM